MYYLNSDGSMDKTTLLSDIPTESAVTSNSSPSTADDYRGCNCNICSRKRKKRSMYPRWFSWINIIIFLLLVGVTVMISCSGNKIFTLFSGGSSNTVSNFSENPIKIMPPPPPPQTPVAGAAADGTDFELPLL